MLDVARAIASDPLEHVELQVALVGCEESGMGGMSAWLAARPDLTPRTTLVLSLDTVGSGTPIVAAAEGAVRTHRYRERDLALSDEGAALAGLPAPQRWRIGAWTDPLVALRAGLPAISLLSIGSRLLPALSPPERPARARELGQRGRLRADRARHAARARPAQRAALTARARTRPRARGCAGTASQRPVAPTEAGALPRPPLPEWRAMSSKQPKNKPSSAAPASSGSRRNAVLAVIVAVIVAAAVIAVIASGGDDDKASSNGGTTTSSLAGTSETKALFEGIEQDGDTIGKANAPVTMYEFIDYQCPFCRQFRLGTYPKVVADNVKSGKLKIISRPLTFIGPESEKAARAAAAAGEQDKEATFTQLFYFNQGEENAGYVTDEFIDKLYDASGVDKAKANAFRKSIDSRDGINAARKEGETYGVVSTPTFVIGPVRRAVREARGRHRRRGRDQGRRRLAGRGQLAPPPAARAARSRVPRSGCPDPRPADPT